MCFQISRDVLRDFRSQRCCPIITPLRSSFVYAIRDILSSLLCEICVILILNKSRHVIEYIQEQICNLKVLPLPSCVLHLRSRAKMFVKVRRQCACAQPQTSPWWGSEPQWTHKHAEETKESMLNAIYLVFILFFKQKQNYLHIFLLFFSLQVAVILTTFWIIKQRGAELTGTEQDTNHIAGLSDRDGTCQTSGAFWFHLFNLSAHKSIVMQ